MIPVLLPLAGIVEIGGGLAILLGAQARTAAMLLFLYLIPATFVFHNFWGQTGMEYVNQMHHFLKNLAIMGGLALIVGLGPGFPSVDGWRARH
jgi:putative oxidoreductase